MVEGMGLGKMAEVSESRKVARVFRARATVEGAGVRLRRAFGNTEVPGFDPFLMLDDFHSDDPADYSAGFPWHPHRGIETITYMLHGEIEHADSMGNGGVIGAGDVQWMTAGSGIIHQEMPRVAAEPGGERLLWGFQLWANLPADHKMMAPRYQDIRAATVPRVEVEGGVLVRVICGEVAGAQGPVSDIVIEPEYLDVSVPKGSSFVRAIPRIHNAFAYVIAGSGSFDRQGTPPVGRESAVLFATGDEVAISCPEESARFLLVSGRPLGEPVAWGGPIVMNTGEELEQAFREYSEGTFVKRP
jgi:quercetin 2,3-dioxygenase